jgi:hypothetical protein
VQPERQVFSAALAAACALAALGGLAPAASARSVDRESATAVLPTVSPFGELRKGERIVTLSARTTADAQIEVTLQAMCFDRLRFRRRQRSFSGTGRVHARIRRPRGRFRDCTASASVRVESRPLTDTGDLPPPIRLGAALYAGR